MLKYLFVFAINLALVNVYRIKRMSTQTFDFEFLLFNSSMIYYTNGLFFCFNLTEMRHVVLVSDIGK